MRSSMAALLRSQRECRSPMRAMQGPKSAQSVSQLLERARAHGLVLATGYGIPHRPIEGRQILGMEPARLSFLQPQPHHADAMLHVIIHGLPVTIEEGGRGQFV